MIDIHTHILYDIEGDDGSRSQEMTLEMLKMAVNSGTTAMIATPHINRQGIIPSWQSILDRVEQVNQLAAVNELPIKIYSGGEVQLDYDAMAKLTGENREYCLADSRYILIELTENSEAKAVEQMLFELMLRGYMPILAHPERYTRIMHHPEIVLEWMHKGIATQCNTGSFHGYFGEKVQARVERLYRHRMITFLGTDAHRESIRTPDSTPAKQAICQLPNGEIFWNNCQSNAQFILEDRVLYPDVPASYETKKRGFFSRLFG